MVAGGGAVGAAIAFFLARRGVRTALIEKGTLGGQGATAYAGAIVRSYDPDPALAPLCHRGSRLFSDWIRMGFPGPAPFSQTGFLYIAPGEAAGRLEAHARLATRRYPIRLLGAKEAQGRLPRLDPRILRGAAVLYEPMGGVANPRLAVQCLAAGIRSLGGTVLENLAVSGWSADSLGISAHCGGAALRAGLIVIAGGSWIRDLAPGLPIRCRNIPMGLFQGPVDAPVVDEITNNYYCPAGRGHFWAGCKLNTAGRPDGPRPRFLPRHRQDSERRIRSTFGIGGMRFVSGLMGFDGYTRDNRPLIGYLPGRRDAYVAAGFSGRGLKSSLAVGEAVAGHILSGASPPASLAPFAFR